MSDRREVSFTVYIEGNTYKSGRERKGYFLGWGQQSTYAEVGTYDNVVAIVEAEDGQVYLVLASSLKFFPPEEMSGRLVI